MSKVVYISKSSIEPKRGPLVLLICRACLSRNVRIRRERNRSFLEVAKSYSLQELPGFGLRADSSRPAPSRFWVAQEKT
jgi:hypothetical protein